MNAHPERGVLRILGLRGVQLQLLLLEDRCHLCVFGAYDGEQVLRQNLGASHLGVIWAAFVHTQKTKRKKGSAGKTF